MIKRLPFKFENRMTKTQTILGWIYLPVHLFVLPMLLSLLMIYGPQELTEAKINLLYYAIGILFSLTVMLKYLRTNFDVLLDKLRLCFMTILLAVMIEYALSTFAAVILLLFEDTIENPNYAEVISIATKEYGTIKAVAIFLAPIVEEILFRGVVFGSIRTRSRGLAYVVSVLLFSFYHVWQYALVTGDPKTLIFALQYIPVSCAITWAYERSGCIWTTIFFHMGYNAISFTVLNLMESF